MTIKEIEKTQDYKDWAEKLSTLNDYINSLTTWNSYAEDCQREYDFLLAADPRKKVTA